MYLSMCEQRWMADLFACLAEDHSNASVRLDVGRLLLRLMRADYFASYVWDAAGNRFAQGVTVNMSLDNLGCYERYYQFHDPITFKLKARCVPTLVSEVMPQRDLARTEFFNDFLARDGLHWGVNMYCVSGSSHVGDVRIWRSRRRENFDQRELDILALVRPAMTRALERAEARRQSVHARSGRAAELEGWLSPREAQVARLVSEGLADKEIARNLRVSVTTVRTHIDRLFGKLGVHKRSAVGMALQRHADQGRPHRLGGSRRP